MSLDIFEKLYTIWHTLYLYSIWLIHHIIFSVVTLLLIIAKNTVFSVIIVLSAITGNTVIRVLKYQIILLAPDIAHSYVSLASNYNILYIRRKVDRVLSGTVQIRSNPEMSNIRNPRDSTPVRLIEFIELTVLIVSIFGVAGSRFTLIRYRFSAPD